MPTELITFLAGGGLTILGSYASHVMDRSRERERASREREAEALRFERERGERNDGLRRDRLEQIYLALLAHRREIGKVEKAINDGVDPGESPGLDASHIQMLVELYAPAAEEATKLLVERTARVQYLLHPILGGQSVAEGRPETFFEATMQLREAETAVAAAVAAEVRSILEPLAPARGAGSVGK